MVIAPQTIAPARKPAVAVLVRTMPKAVQNLLHQTAHLVVAAVPRPEHVL